MDKTGKSYWNNFWGSKPLPSAFDPLDKSLRNTSNHRLHELFTRAFSDMQTQNKNILEIGCARSVWLPYFSKQFGFNVFGIDYSEIGCREAKQILEDEGVQGVVVQADFLFPPDTMFSKFDVVVSLGVIEHNNDPSYLVKMIAQYVKPGGIVFTAIPNFIGLVGFFHKQINRPVYNVHFPMDVALLKQIHQQAGLKILKCEYFMFTNFSVINLRGLARDSILWVIKKLGRNFLLSLTVLCWLFEKYTHYTIPSNWITSPYIYCLAKKIEKRE